MPAHFDWDLLSKATPLILAGVCVMAIWKRQWLAAIATFSMCLMAATQLLQNKIIDQIWGYVALVLIPIFCVVGILYQKARFPRLRWLWLMFMVIWFLPAAAIPIGYRVAILLAVIFAYVFRPETTEVPGKVR